jgi:predicted cupin superfamily sugar epimerase
MTIMTSEARRIIEVLDLSPHPEGGFFREIFRAPLELHGLPGDKSRSASTSIYYLLPAGVFSAFHVVSGADEVWHHYLGDTVEIHTITDEGVHAVSKLGVDMDAGERPQAIVPAGTLQAAVVTGDAFALCGCTVSPGFDFADFSIPGRADLLARFPQHAQVIKRLTRDE